jgi:amino acid adenylation domain-containing protein
VLDAGGRTVVPRWTLEPVPGEAEVRVELPAGLDARVRRLAGRVGVPRSAVLLAAHAKVLAALSGEADVSTGFLVAHRRALPCAVSTAPESWSDLLREAWRAEAGLRAHGDFPLEDLRQEMGVTGPLSETLLDPGGAPGPLPAGTVLAVGPSEHPSPPALAVRYRTDVLDAASAERIAGYHLTALALAAADPEGPHRRHSLLTTEELRFQLDGLAGPHRPLPDLRCHELFEEQVRIHPETIAAVYGDQELSYRELNARANRVGHALRATGLRREAVVAVVTERNLDWLAAVLGILKAGAVYLPIEPHFPADRIARMLSRAECAVVLTEEDSARMLDEALAALDGVRRLLIEEACESAATDENLGVSVAPDQLAYIYFTSGSTGEPKGAMCEHAGMVNHVLAKVQDLEIRPGQVVAQTAPQCFDISLWQLLAPLVAGGRTHLVEQDVILDVERFVDRIVAGRVGVLQVVPSYLEAVLSYLERQPRALPDLRCVSVTGEAFKPELAQRWFAAQPGVRLVNAYGLTETSDDTNHEVLLEPPRTSRVPLGRPIHNVRVYVVDESLQPVPLGAPGELVFSGVCVGRGYVNDPERTRRAFTSDPYRPGARLYRSGDLGRWLPDGKVEFLGRRDSQVKVRGFRIEIGEVENALLRTPGVRDGAVVVAQPTGQAGHLVGFYTAKTPLDSGWLKDTLAQSLPEYMVPAVLHWQQSLPLTANGKVDKRTLTALTAEPGATADEPAAPVTPTERRLAAAWAQVLAVPEQQIGRRDSFFDRGGTSLTAVKLAVTLDRAVSLRDLIDHPVLADLAALLDDRAKADGRPLRLLPPPDGLRSASTCSSAPIERRSR